MGALQLPCMKKNLTITDVERPWMSVSAEDHHWGWDHKGPQVIFQGQLLARSGGDWFNMEENDGGQTNMNKQLGYPLIEGKFLLISWCFWKTTNWAIEWEKFEWILSQWNGEKPWWKTKPHWKTLGLVCRIVFCMPIEEVTLLVDQCSWLGKLTSSMQITSTNGGLSIAMFFTQG